LTQDTEQRQRKQKTQKAKNMYMSNKDPQ